MGMETKQIFSIPPNPKPRKKRVDHEINNYCAKKMLQKDY